MQLLWRISLWGKNNATIFLLTSLYDMDIDGLRRWWNNSRTWSHSWRSWRRSWRSRWLNSNAWRGNFQQPKHGRLKGGNKIGRQRGEVNKICHGNTKCGPRMFCKLGIATKKHCLSCWFDRGKTGRGGWDEEPGAGGADFLHSCPTRRFPTLMSASCSLRLSVS